MSDFNLQNYNTLQKIHVLLDDGDRHALTPFSLSSTQYHALLHLHNAGEQGLTISGLAHKLICTTGNATRLVRRLEEQAFIHLTRDTADRRIIYVRLTPAGYNLFHLAQQRHLQSIHRRFGRLPLLEREKLSQLIAEVASVLENDLDQLDKPLVDE